MKITIVCVGKIKEKFYQDAIKEYAKRLSRYISLSILEVKDIEGERILKNIREDGYVIALAIEGKPLDSVEMAHKIDSLGLGGTSHIYFVIGGSLGLSEAVLQRADFKLSFSRMTFPHQLMRVILLEQIYRSCRIINHEPYHK